jgi:hypothetical protein
MGRDVKEYTGTHGYLRYPDANNNPAPIFLYNANGKQVNHELKNVKHKIRYCVPINIFVEYRYTVCMYFVH